MNEQKLKKKLTFMIVTVVLLSLGLAITSFALASSIVSIRNNRFSMSMGVELTINDGKPVVDVTDMVYEPGGTYVSEFPIANLGTFDVWYRVYFTDVKGVLKDYITVTIKEADGTVLCKGTMSELSSDKVAVSSLAAGEEKTLTIEFYFSSEAGNAAQGQSVSFNITANATQKQNNPNKDFGN
jgi:hypothetical protein